MKILLLDSNLFGATRVESNLRAHHHDVSTRAQLPSDTADFDIVIFNFGNFNQTAATIPAAIEAAKIQFPSAKILGFCGHREVEKWRVAQPLVHKMASNDQMMGDAGEVVGALVARP